MAGGTCERERRYVDRASIPDFKRLLRRQSITSTSTAMLSTSVSHNPPFPGLFALQMLVSKREILRPVVVGDVVAPGPDVITDGA
jgi:formate hydrogenlyase subunit 3/multisubunit Na+/H+ antiporter MnhD subunit